MRVLGPRAFGPQETVFDAVPNQFIDYGITRNSGPITNHHGRMTFSETKDGGSRLQYSIQFQGVVPGAGPLLKHVLETTIKKGLDRFAHASDSAT